MSMKEQVFTALEALVGGRVYPVAAPEIVVTPYIVYQRTGGKPVNYIDGAIPDLKNARIQVNVWGATMGEADPIAAQVEIALRQAAGLRTTVLSEVLDTFDETTKRRGTMQDFSVWT